MKGRVLVAGFATRHVAQSAYLAGYEVCAVDHFCDQDLSWYTQDREKFLDLEDLPGAIDRICTRHRFDLFVPTSGAETLSPPIPLCGTPSDRIARFLDKLDIHHFFESLDVPVPRILPDGIVNSYEMGESIEEIREDWPSLSAAQIDRLIEFAHVQRGQAHP